MNPEDVNNSISEVVELVLRNGKKVKLRTYVPGAARESIVDAVAKNIFDGVDYCPCRKEPLLVEAFVTMYVVGGIESLVRDPSYLDTYVIYHMIVKELRFIEQIQDSRDRRIEKLSEAYCEIEGEIDDKVHYLMMRSYADLAGGGTNAAVQTAEELSGFLAEAKETVALFKDFMNKNQRKLSRILSQKNVNNFLNMAEGYVEQSRTGKDH